MKLNGYIQDFYTEKLKICTIENYQQGSFIVNLYCQFVLELPSLLELGDFIEFTLWLFCTHRLYFFNLIQYPFTYQKNKKQNLPSVWLLRKNGRQDNKILNLNNDSDVVFRVQILRILRPKRNEEKSTKNTSESCFAFWQVLLIYLAYLPIGKKKNTSESYFADFFFFGDFYLHTLCVK